MRRREDKKRKIWEEEKKNKKRGRVEDKNEGRGVKKKWKEKMKIREGEMKIK